jgi:hypothetical protein
VIVLTALSKPNDIHVLRLPIQHLPIGSSPRSASTTSAISHTMVFVAPVSCWIRLSILQTPAICNSSSFFDVGLHSRLGRAPSRRSLRGPRSGP